MKSLLARIQLCRLWLMLAFGLAPATMVPGQTTIVYHQPSEPLFQLGGRQLDVNGDGQPDCKFDVVWVDQANYWYNVASGVGTARLLVTPLAPRDPGGYLLGWDAGYLIGGATNEWLFWAAADAPNGYGVALVSGAYVPEDAGGGLIGTGDFYNRTAFMGIQFQTGLEWHYGWVRIRGGTAGVSDDGQHFYLPPPGWILDWAYETQADTPIKAGQTKSPLSFIASLSGANEVPPNNNRHSGSGRFTLESYVDRYSLIYHIECDGLFLPTSAGIFGPAYANSISRHLIGDLGNALIVWSNPPTIGPIPFVIPQPPIILPPADLVVYDGQITLTSKQVAQLVCGKSYVNLKSSQFPRGEIRGQILSTAPIQFAASLSGRKGALRSQNRRYGSAAFTLTGNSLAYDLTLDSALEEFSAAILGPSRTRIELGPLIGELVSTNRASYTGTNTLTDWQVERLKRGELWLGVSTAPFPQREIRGVILPLDSNGNGVADYIDDLIEQVCPCDGAWRDHREYVRAVRRLAEELATARLITCQQFIQIIRRAEHCDYGKVH